MSAGVPYHEAMDEWLAHFDKYPGTKRPQEVTRQIKDKVAKAQRLEKRIAAEGPKIVYVWVTHETAAGAIMHELTGKNTKELGGPIGHLEPMKVSLDGEEPGVTFRNETHTLNVG